MSSVTPVEWSAKTDLVERWFFTAIAGAMFAVAISGFLPSIAFPSGRHAPVSLLAATHGVLSFVWLGIFLAQARLVADRRVRLHKRVGTAASLVAVLMVPLAYATCIEMVRRGFDLSGDLRAELDPAYAVIFPLGDLLMFSVLFTSAIAFRHRPEIHRTLILFANITLIPAPLAHLIGHVPWLAATQAPIILLPISLFLAAAIARDFILKKTVRPLTWGLAASMFISGPLRAFVIGPSPQWHEFVHRLAR